MAAMGMAGPSLADAGVMPTMSARWPPAEAPVTAMRAGSTWYFAPRSKNHLAAWSASLTAAGAGAAPATRYSTWVIKQPRFTLGRHKDCIMVSFVLRSQPPPGNMITPGRFSVEGALGYRTPSRVSGKRSRSEEHTSELQSLTNIVCRLLLEK